MILALVLHARIGAQGDINEVPPENVFATDVIAGDAFGIDLLGLTKSTKNRRNLNRFDHMSIFVPPPEVADALRLFRDQYRLQQQAQSSNFATFPSPFDFPPALQRLIGHRLKHTATRILQQILLGSPYAELLTDMASHHLSESNPTRTRVAYLGRTGMAAHIAGTGLPIALTLLADYLALRAGIKRALSDSQVLELKRILRVGERIYR